ncbi:lysine--tRNA ligase [PVC group bacterium (ex Bugula neritina AB1)]|nr:lysine--tRNA ligase [PVC group bacterium (ex Bugula neritina AB1)]
MSEIRDVRIKKRQELMDAGMNPYGKKFLKTHTIESFLKVFEKDLEVSLTGRMVLLRGHGKTLFADIKDETGKVQTYFHKDILGSENMDFVKKLDVGDIIGVKGKAFLTRTGEPTILIESFEILSKSLMPLPEKFHGLKNQELRVRQRYLDLIVNDEVRERFKFRSQMIQKTRQYLESLGYMEVETPMMHDVAGGAAAKPFITHHNTLDLDLYLRIAPELYLKRLLVGGFEKVYEINRNFRNEGVSPRHNPEFTMLELYAAYGNYEDMMKITEDLIVHLVQERDPSMVLKWGDHSLDFSTPWKRVSMKDAVKDHTGVNIDTVNLKELSAKYGFDDSHKMTRAGLLAHIFEEEVEKTLINPTFVIDFPTELCPLSKTHPHDPTLSERFELFIGGQEIANAYSELNDPVEQKRRFQDQIDLREGEDGYSIDEDFVNALEYGMPPAGGLGIGIDRLAMLLTGVVNIREVILFPQMRKDGSTS